MGPFSVFFFFFFFFWYTVDNVSDYFAEWWVMLLFFFFFFFFPFFFFLKVLVPFMGYSNAARYIGNGNELCLFCNKILGKSVT